VNLLHLFLLTSIFRESHDLIHEKNDTGHQSVSVYEGPFFFFEIFILPIGKEAGRSAYACMQSIDFQLKLIYTKSLSTDLFISMRKSVCNQGNLQGSMENTTIYTRYNSTQQRDTLKADESPTR
jgi:hypothetical protein